MQVPLDHFQDGGDSLAIRFAVIQKAEKRSPGMPVLFLQGGPGKSALHDLATWKHHPLQRQHDIVIMDFRGTGYSSPLKCSGLTQGLWNMLAADLDVDAQLATHRTLYDECLQNLEEQDVDLNHYSIGQVTSDIVSLRRFLGIKKWMLYGVSYGTVAAQRLAAKDGDAIGGAILDSFIPIRHGHWQGQVNPYYRTVKGLARRCAADTACTRSYGDLMELFERVSNRIEDEPIRLNLGDEHFVINHQDFHVAVQQMLYSSALYPLFPELLTAFEERDPVLLGNLVRRMETRLGQFNGVSQFAILGSNGGKREYWDWQMMEFPAYMENGLAYIDQQGELLKTWPIDNDSIPADSLLDFQAPVLFINGELDPVTPAGTRDGFMKDFEKVYSVTIPNGGHMSSLSNLCAQRIMFQFAHSPGERPDMSCSEQTSNISFIDDIYRNSKMYNLANDIFLHFQPRPVFLCVLAVVMFLFNFIAMFVRWNRDKRERPSKRLMNRTWGGQGLCGLLVMGFLLMQLTEAVTLNQWMILFGLPHSSTGFWLKILSMAYLVYSAFALLALLRYAFMGFSIKLGFRYFFSAIATIAFTIIVFTYGLV